MRVKFIRQFFGPNGVRYRPDRWHDLPDSWKDRLPQVPDKKNPGKMTFDCEIDESAFALETLPLPLVPAAQARTAQNALSEMESVGAETRRAKK